MIEAVTKQRGIAPYFVCDQCHEIIENAGYGLAAMPQLRINVQGRTEVLHVHKGKCYKMLEDKWDGRVGSVELLRHIELLIHNSRVELSDIQKLRDNYEQIGL